MVDQDRVRAMRRELEGWREILVGLHSVLMWEKQFFPGIIFAAVSFIFILIWYIDPAVLTLFSLIGILITLCDYSVPQVTPMVFGANNWTGSQERKYEQIIVSLAGGCNMLHSFINTMKTAKTTKPKTYFITVTLTLLLCAWIGSSVDNLFLTYLSVLLAIMFPGLRRQDAVKKYLDMVSQQIGTLLKGKEGDGSKDAKKD